MHGDDEVDRDDEVERGAAEYDVWLLEEAHQQEPLDVLSTIPNNYARAAQALQPASQS